MTTTLTRTMGEQWLAERSPEFLASTSPEVLAGTVAMLDGLLDKMARLFTGDCDRTGHMPAWLMPTAEWEALGSPRTAEAWTAALS